jgi:hypothetical protein
MDDQGPRQRNKADEEEAERAAWEVYRQLNGLRARGGAQQKQQQQQKQQEEKKAAAARRKDGVVVLGSSSSDDEDDEDEDADATTDEADEDASVVRKERAKQQWQRRQRAKAAEQENGKCVKRRRDKKRPASSDDDDDEQQPPPRAPTVRELVHATCDALQQHMPSLPSIDLPPPREAMLAAGAYGAAMAAHVSRKRLRRDSARAAALRRARRGHAEPPRDEAEAQDELLRRDEEAKVFVAGVPFGVSLPSACLDSRRVLARALGDAMQGEIPSLGRGETLSAVFLDAAGRSTEVGPTRGGGGGAGSEAASAASSDKAASAAWRRAASTAVRVYVRDVAWMATLELQPPPPPPPPLLANKKHR